MACGHLTSVLLKCLRETSSEKRYGKEGVAEKNSLLHEGLESRKKGNGIALLAFSSWPFNFNWACPQPAGIVPLTFRMDLFLPLNHFWKCLHRHIPRSAPCQSPRCF